MYWLLNTRSPWFGGKCISSKSPCVKAMSHQITANANHDRKKLNANTSNVQRHCESTNVVKMSCKKRILLCAIFFWMTLHSPFLRTALRRIFLELPGRYPRLLGKRIHYFPNIFLNVWISVVWIKERAKKKNQIFKLQIVQFRLMFVVSYQMLFPYEEFHYVYV